MKESVFSFEGCFNKQVVFSEMQYNIILTVTSYEKNCATIYFKSSARIEVVANVLIGLFHSESNFNKMITRYFCSPTEIANVQKVHFYFNEKEAEVTSNSSKEELLSLYEAKVS